MRLGQLARKYDVGIEKVIAHLKDIGAYHNELTPNSKLNEETRSLIASHFENSGESSPENTSNTSEVIEEVLIEPIEESVKTFEVPSQGVEDILLPESEFQALPKKDKESIETDRLLELLESEDEEVDLSNITLIKAPKKELSGLKVLGKIELEEPKTKATEDAEENEDVKPKRKNSTNRQQLSAEELEDKRLKFKKRRKDYEARQVRLEKEKRQEQKKAVKKAHYEHKVKRAEPIRIKKKSRLPDQQELPEVIEPRPIPKTLLGKFWRWLDAPK